MLSYFTGASALAKTGMVIAILTFSVGGIFAAGIAMEKLRGSARDARYSATASDAQRDVYDDTAYGVRDPNAAR